MSFQLVLLTVFILKDVVAARGSSDIQLYGGNATAGVVQMLANNTWGTICDDHWGVDDARVACKQLGLSGGQAVSRAPEFFGIQLYKDRALEDSPVHYKNVRCWGNEDSLLDCDPSKNEKRCGHTEDAGVVCDSVVFIVITDPDADKAPLSQSDESKPLIEDFVFNDNDIYIADFTTAATPGDGKADANGDTNQDGSNEKMAAPIHSNACCHLANKNVALILTCFILWM